MRLFSTRDRPVHLGPFPLERLARRAGLPDLAQVEPMRALAFDAADPLSIVHAMARYQAMFDLVRDGPVQAAPAEIPDDPAERARHLKAAGTCFDASMDALHREYFSVPEAPARQNHPFVLKLLRSGRTVEVAAERSATEALAEAGIAIPTKCSDGLCGVCATAYDAAASDEVAHRDFVLSRRERAHELILCCSRALNPGGIVAIDL